MISYLPRLAVAGLTGLVLTASCTPSITLNHYTLHSQTIRNVDDPQPKAFSQSISLGPITLPDIVDRPQLVLRTSEHRVVFTETHRWAGPLKAEIARVLADHLAYLLGTRSISFYPQRGAERAEVKVSVDVQRFESILGKTATIDAIWTVQWADGMQRTDNTHVQESVTGETYDALVAAHSRALMAVSQGIASSIRGGGVAASSR